MRRVIVVAAVVTLVAMSAAATDQGDVVKIVHQFTDGFNKGDVASALATCASPVSIIDEFPPYEWRGANGCSDWARDYDADAKKGGITDGKVTLGKPWHVDVSGDRAYVVVPAKYAFTKKGKPVLESASIRAVALQKQGSEWKIVAWSWSKH